MTALLEVNNLKKYFPITGGVFSNVVGQVKAVDGISFSLRESEIFGLVGESGCGKSTAGRTILNLTQPTSGSVRFEDKLVFDVEKGIKLKPPEMRSLRRDMQIIFQDPYASLNPRMTIGAILTEGMLKHKLYTKPEARERAIGLLEKCGLQGSYMSKYPHEFSGGQRQRVGIARALALNPKLIIGDEPIAALDVSIQAQVLTLLQELIAEFNLTTIFISHDLSVVRYFCDTIAVMYLGSFVETGSSSDLFVSPLHPYTEALISAVPKAQPSEEKRRIILKGDIPSPSNPPKGCKFHTRCPKVMDVCSKEVPLAKEVTPGHVVSCHLYD